MLLLKTASPMLIAEDCQPVADFLCGSTADELVVALRPQGCSR